MQLGGAYLLALEVGIIFSCKAHIFWHLLSAV
jgi:hypothetical protein